MPRERGSKSMLDLSLAMQYKARQRKGWHCMWRYDDTRVAFGI